MQCSRPEIVLRGGVAKVRWAAFPQAWKGRNRNVKKKFSSLQGRGVAKGKNKSIGGVKD